MFQTTNQLWFKTTSMFFFGFLAWLVKELHPSTSIYMLYLLPLQSSSSWKNITEGSDSKALKLHQLREHFLGTSTAFQLGPPNISREVAVTLGILLGSIRCPVVLFLGTSNRWISIWFVQTKIGITYCAIWESTTPICSEFRPALKETSIRRFLGSREVTLAHAVQDKCHAMEILICLEMLYLPPTFGNFNGENDEKMMRTWWNVNRFTS